MVKIKIDILHVELGIGGEVKKKKPSLITFWWLNPFRWRKRKLDEESVEAVFPQQEKEEIKRPEGWIHPPLPKVSPLTPQSFGPAAPPRPYRQLCLC